MPSRLLTETERVLIQNALHSYAQISAQEAIICARAVPELGPLPADRLKVQFGKQAEEAINLAEAIDAAGDITIGVDA